MHLFAAVLAITVVIAVSGRKNFTSSPKCGPNEDPVKGRPRRDRFCRPLYTPRDVWTRRRTCICKRGYVRNSWDECVSRKDCGRCWCRLQKEWHLCASPCPVICNRKIERCTRPCSPGCDCPPGWVLHPKNWRLCVKADKCVPNCPQNSTFKSCVSSCEPKCGTKVRKQCITQCHRGSCVCDEGFTKYIKNRKQSCLLKESCPTFTIEKPLNALNESLLTGTSNATPSTPTSVPQSTPPPGIAGTRITGRPTHTPATGVTGSTGLSGVNTASSAAGVPTNSAGKSVLSGGTASAGSMSATNTSIHGTVTPSPQNLSIDTETSLSTSGTGVGLKMVPGEKVSSTAVLPATAATDATSPTVAVATAATASAVTDSPTADTAYSAATTAPANSASTTGSTGTSVSAVPISSLSTDATSVSATGNPTEVAPSADNLGTGTPTGNASFIGKEMVDFLGAGADVGCP